MTQGHRGGRPARFFSDVAYKILAGCILAFGIFVFLAGAIYGFTFVARLGGAGYIIYAVVIGTFAMVMGPVLVSSVSMYQRGSRKHRDGIERRREEQKVRYSYADRIVSEKAAERGERSRDDQPGPGSGS